MGLKEDWKFPGPKSIHFDNKKVMDSAQPISVPQKGNKTIIRTDNSINMTIDNIDIIWAKKISIVFSNTSSELTPSMTFDPLSTNLPFSRVVGEVSQVDLSLRHSSSQAWVWNWELVLLRRAWATARHKMVELNTCEPSEKCLTLLNSRFLEDLLHSSMITIPWSMSHCTLDVR